jgi:hypothetical protein
VKLLAKSGARSSVDLLDVLACYGPRWYSQRFPSMLQMGTHYQHRNPRHQDRVSYYQRLSGLVYDDACSLWCFFILVSRNHIRRTVHTSYPRDHDEIP